MSLEMLKEEWSFSVGKKAIKTWDWLHTALPGFAVRHEGPQTSPQVYQLYTRLQTGEEWRAALEGSSRVKGFYVLSVGQLDASRAGLPEAWPVCLEAEKQEEKRQCSAKRPREEFSRNSTSLQSLSPQSSPNHQWIRIQQRCICSILSPKRPSLCWNNSRI